MVPQGTADRSGATRALPWPTHRSLARNERRELGERNLAPLPGRMRVNPACGVVDLGATGTEAVAHPRGDLDQRDAGRQQPGGERAAQVVVVPTSAQPRICRCLRYADLGR